MLRSPLTRGHHYVTALHHPANLHPTYRKMHSSGNSTLNQDALEYQVRRLFALFLENVIDDA